MFKFMLMLSGHIQEKPMLSIWDDFPEDLQEEVMGASLKGSTLGDGCLLDIENVAVPTLGYQFSSVGHAARTGVFSNLVSGSDSGPAQTVI